MGFSEEDIARKVQDRHKRQEWFRSLLVLFSILVFVGVAWMLRMGGVGMTDEVSGDVQAVLRGDAVFAGDAPFPETVSSGNVAVSYVARAENPVIYVDTALGLREKDRIHEYGDHAYFPPGVTPVDGYIPNTDQQPYVLHPGESVILVAEMDIDPNYYPSGDVSLYPIDRPWFKIDMVSYKDYLELLDSVEIVEGSVRRVTVKVAVKEDSPAGDCVVLFGNDTDVSERFYLRVKNQWDMWDHADIEVMDNGFFNIIEPLPDGKSRRMSYTAYIVGVNSCDIYDKENNKTLAGNNEILTFAKEDYQSNGVPGEPQYELTSKYLCEGKAEKHFFWKDADHAVFDVKIRLKPKSIEILDGIGNVIDTEPVDSTGNSDLWIQSAIFQMNHRSMIDANNKCPDHSGLDFTLDRNLNDLILRAPVSVDFTAEKTFDGGLAAGMFEFELVDADGQVLDRVSNDASGNIRFDRQYFVNPGEYSFSIREVIPPGAVDIGDGVMYYKGVFYDKNVHSVTVTVADDGGGSLIKPADPPTPSFSNSICPEDSSGDEYIAISVEKKWDDNGADHSGDTVAFRIWRREKGNPAPAQTVTVNGQSLFELSEANGWKWNCHDLPSMVQGHSYSYEVEEVDPPTGYVPIYSHKLDADELKYTITNFETGVTSISIRKEWYDAGGNLMAEAPKESVSVSLMREWKEIKIPVKIDIRDSEGNLVDTNELHTYAGSKMTLEMSLAGEDALGKMDKVAVVAGGTANCDCSISWSDAEPEKASIFIENIKPGAKVTVQCDNLLTESDLLLHHDFEDPVNRHNWEVIGSGVYLGDGIATCQSEKPGVYSHALKVGNRAGYQEDGNWIGAWKGARYYLTKEECAKLKPGEAYSFSIYATGNNHFTSDSSEGLGKELPGHVIRAISLTFVGEVKAPEEESKKKKEYENIDSRELPFMSQLSNVQFTIPVWEYALDASFALMVDTDEDVFLEEEGGVMKGYFSDLFIDELVVAPAGVAVSVQRDGRVLRSNAVYGLEVVSEVYPEGIEQRANNWQAESSWTKALALEGAKGWRLTLKAEALEELPNREYRYYAKEDAVPGYTVDYEGNMVATNTPATPIRIKNTAIEYELPQTGSSGRRGMRVLGCLLLFCAACGGCYISGRRRV